MLLITPEGEKGQVLNQYGYSDTKSLLSRIILPITRWLRAKHTISYMKNKGDRLLDIGCGDGYFIRKVKTIQERYGLDAKLGDEVTDKLEFPDCYFDYVTLLAVIEHVEEPAPLLNEIKRVLKPGGQLILTTPKENAEKYIQIYSSEIHEEHEIYYTPATMEKILPEGLKLAGFHNFIFGLNQVFNVIKENT